MKVSVKKQEFLSNIRNKISFICELCGKLLEDGQNVTLSKTDADIDIVKVALKVILKGEQLLSLMKTVLLVIHTFSGCYSTTAIFGHGDVKVFYLFKGTKTFLI